MKLVASCAFGLESIVARELRQLGYQTQTTGPGQVEFSGGWKDICKTNLWLRCADRVSIVFADFACPDFDVLFETTKQVDWPSFVSSNAKIHVTGGSVKSKLTSVPAIQRTVKRAIVDNLLSLKNVNSLPEDGPLFRVHIGIRNDHARLTIDTTGPSLHKRGYREIATKAPLKETMAAALVQLSFWRSDKPLVDPFCGGGTILIEAAMIGRNMAPGLNRPFASEQWSSFPGELWEESRSVARGKAATRLPERILGTDIHDGALSIARRNAKMAGVEQDIHFQRKAFADLSSKREFGCIVTNPPYGDRLDQQELDGLYHSIPSVLQRLPTWSHFILTAYPGFEKLIGRKADRRRKLYNGRIECTYFQFHGPNPDTHRNAKSRAELTPVFGGITQKAGEQAEIFANRLRKRARHLRRWPTRRGITCYRIYDRDIPEIPLVVDRYEDYLHIVEFERPHERDLAQHNDWLQLMARTGADTLEISIDNVFIKSRLRQRRREQHEKLSNVGRELIVNEGGLRFLVNLSDYTDTGLFLDHRAARALVRDISEGKRVLNVFAYTGAFSVYAAAGQAAEVASVDWSTTYLEWARRNFELNNLSDNRYRFIREDARSYIASLPNRPMFDVIVCDPPTFSNSRRTEQAWDVQQHHTEFLNQLLTRLASGGTIFFSSNFRRLRINEDEIRHASIREITNHTLPEDFRNQRVHRSWLISHAN